MRTGLRVQVREEGDRSGGCHGDARVVARASCPQWVTWHILRRAERVIVRA